MFGAGAPDKNSVDIENAFSGMNTECLEYSLIEATLEAISTKSLTPIIKEELKLKIQTKRLASGQEELPKPVFKEPEKPELTQEEIEKRLRRREGNRVAALKCRNKKKQERKSIDTVKSELEQINTSLKRKVEELEKSKAELLYKIKMSKISISNSNCSLDNHSTGSKYQALYTEISGSISEMKLPKRSPSPPTYIDRSEYISHMNSSMCSQSPPPYTDRSEYSSQMKPPLCSPSPPPCTDRSEYISQIKPFQHSPSPTTSIDRSEYIRQVKPSQHSPSPPAYSDMPEYISEIKSPQCSSSSPTFTDRFENISGMKHFLRSPSPSTFTDMSRNLCETNFVLSLPAMHTYNEAQPSTSGAYIDGIVASKPEIDSISNQDFDLWDRDIDFLSEDCHLPKAVKCVSFIPVTVDDEAKVPGEDDVISGAVSPSLYQPFQYEW